MREGDSAGAGPGMRGLPDLDRVFAELDRSAFRRHRRLHALELDDVTERGLVEVLREAREIVRERLGPADPAMDGRQTPYRGHPVFIAQHATGTCCRRCLETCHGIRRGAPLTRPERGYVVAAIERWLRGDLARAGRAVPDIGPPRGVRAQAPNRDRDGPSLAVRGAPPPGVCAPAQNQSRAGPSLAVRGAPPPGVCAPAQNQSRDGPSLTVRRGPASIAQALPGLRPVAGRSAPCADRDARPSALDEAALCRLLQLELFPGRGLAI